MANVVLDEVDWRDGRLPDVCMQCGGHAPDRVKKTFVWQPFATFPSQTRRVALVPMCKAHRNHWLIRTLVSWGVVVPTFVIVGLITRAMSHLDDDSRWADAVYAALFFAMMGSLVLGLLIQWYTIRPTDISDRSLELTNVSPEFVEAYEWLRAKKQTSRTSSLLP